MLGDTHELIEQLKFFHFWYDVCTAMLGIFAVLLEGCYRFDGLR